MSRGNITIFTALSMMLTASLLFTLLESARVHGLNRYAGMKTDTGVEAACAEYQPLLWQDYGLLLLDGAYSTSTFSMDYVTERIQKNLEKNLAQSSSYKNDWHLELFQFKEVDVGLLGYQLITDEKGEVFLNLIAECTKETLPLDLAEKIYQNYVEGKKIEDDLNEIKGAIEDAKQQMNGQKFFIPETMAGAGQEVRSLSEYTGLEKETEVTIENPLEFVEEVKSGSSLELILEGVSSVSDKRIGAADALLEREKEAGTMKADTQADWYRKILVTTYLDKYYTCYTDKQKEHFLDYEMEYVLCGKSTEKENLKGAIERLLLFREAANTMYLLTDRNKMDLAEKIARIIGVFAGENEAVVRTVQMAIIGAWAFLESVLDVRALLAGEKIPFIKNEKQWTSDVYHVAEAFKEGAKAKECEDGFTYKDYLKQMIFFTGNKKLAYRMMDVMEADLHGHEEYKNCRMDHMIVKMHYEVCYQAAPLFYELSVLGRVYREKFYFKKEREFSYIP